MVVLQVFHPTVLRALISCVASLSIRKVGIKGVKGKLAETLLRGVSRDGIRCASWGWDGVLLLVRSAAGWGFWVMVQPSSLGYC